MLVYFILILHILLDLMVENLKAIKIFDTKGQLMLFEEKPTCSIDVSQLSQGLYFVELISYGKIIKNRAINR